MRPRRRWWTLVLPVACGASGCATGAIEAAGVPAALTSRGGALLPEAEPVADLLLWLDDRNLAVSRGHALHSIDFETSTIESATTAGGVVRLTATADGKHFAVGHPDGRAELWTSRPLDLELRTPAPASEAPWSVPFGFLVLPSGDGTSLFVATDRPRVWNVGDGTFRCQSDVRQTFDGAVVEDVALVADTLAYARIGLATCAVEEEGYTSTGGTFPTRVDPRGDWVAASDGDGHELGIYRTRPFRRVAVLAKVSSCEEHILPSFSPDGSVLWARGGKRWFRSFRVGTFDEIARYRPRSSIDAASPFPDGRRLVLRRGTENEIVDLGSGRRTCRFESPSQVHVSPGGNHLAILEADRVVVRDSSTCEIAAQVALEQL